MSAMGIVADDLTGGTTVAALLADSGVDNVVLLDVAHVEEIEDGATEAIIVSTDSRPLPPEVARARVASATRSLSEAGAVLFSKRTDTTMRGGIGYEVEGMLSQMDDDAIAVFVPAMPQSKRVVVGGYSLIDSTLLERTPVAQDVRTPVSESHLPTLLRSQLSIPLEHIGIAAVIGGKDTLAASLEEARAHGARAIVVDAVSLEDISLIAAVLVDLRWKIVCVDPGPFTVAYALRRGVHTRPKIEKNRLRVATSSEDRGTVVVVAGSATPVTNTQLANLVVAEGTTALPVRVAPLIRGGVDYDAECGRVLDELERLWNVETRPRVLVVALESSLTGNLVDMDAIEDSSGITRGEGASQLAARLGSLGRRVMDRVGDQLAGVYLTGGDVMVNTCRAMEAQGLSLEAYVIPQSDQGRLVGGPFSGVPVVGKGGLTGDRLTAVHIVNRLFDERKVS